MVEDSEAVGEGLGVCVGEGLGVTEGKFRIVGDWVVDGENIDGKGVVDWK